MGATSITVRDRENVFHKLEAELLDQGTKYILEKEFMLGKGINQTKSDFLVQYTSLLCNDNCDINALIESKIKGLEGIECVTKMNFQAQLNNLSDSYYEWLAQGNTGNFIEYLLQSADVSTCVSWSESTW